LSSPKDKPPKGDPHNVFTEKFHDFVLKLRKNKCTSWSPTLSISRKKHSSPITTDVKAARNKPKILHKKFPNSEKDNLHTNLWLNSFTVENYSRTLTNHGSPKKISPKKPSKSPNPRQKQSNSPKTRPFPKIPQPGSKFSLLRKNMLLKATQKILQKINDRNSKKSGSIGSGCRCGNQSGVKENLKNSDS
jgi:hypothetical protein